jgi:hypothetical protein
MMLPGGGVSSVVSLVVLLVVVEVPVGFVFVDLVTGTVLVVFMAELVGAACVPFLTVWRDVYTNWGFFSNMHKTVQVILPQDLLSISFV